MAKYKVTHGSRGRRLNKKEKGGCWDKRRQRPGRGTVDGLKAGKIGEKKFGGTDEAHPRTGGAPKVQKALKVKGKGESKRRLGERQRGGKGRDDKTAERPGKGLCEAQD